MRIVVCAFSLLFVVGVALAERPDLTGRVVDSGENGIEGANVYIWEGRVKVGTSTYCPSCYPDCGKKAVVDADGRFTIESLDPELLFHVLAVAEGYIPTFLEKVDPADGEVMFVLGKIPEERLQPPHRVNGRVVDPEGKPIAGAKIEPYGMEFDQPGVDQPGIRFGALDSVGVDPLAVSNTKGEFFFTSQRPDRTFYVRISARDSATQIVHPLSAGGEVQEIVLQRGVTVTGYVQNGGEGVPNVEIGLVQVDRGAKVYTGAHTVGTFDNGYFEFPNIPANTEYYVYGIMESFQGIGTVRQRMVSTDNNETRTEIEPFEVQPGFSIAGKVLMSDGSEIPEATRLLLSSVTAYNALSRELGTDGAFHMTDIPPGEYEIHIRVPGYRLSADNYSLDPLYRRSLMGIIDKDNRDLAIQLEPGEPEPFERDHNDYSIEALKRVRSISDQHRSLKQVPIRGTNDAN